MAEKKSKSGIILLAIAGLAVGALAFAMNKKEGWESPNTNFKITKFDLFHFTCDNNVLPPDMYIVGFEIFTDLNLPTYSLIGVLKDVETGVEMEAPMVFTQEQIDNKETTIDLTPGVESGDILLDKNYEVSIYLNDKTNLVFKTTTKLDNATESGKHPLCL